MDSPLAESREFEELLGSSLPSERMAAARYFVTNPADADARLLATAMSRESVPSIRRLLRQAGQLSRPSKITPSEDTPELSAAEIVRHELEPAIGWVRLAAMRAVDDFDDSGLASEIRGLEDRMDGLIAVLDLERAPVNFTLVSLPDLVLACMPHHHGSPPPLSIEIDGNDGISVATDQQLLGTLLRNALSNAVDAVAQVDEEKRVLAVHLSAVKDRFQIQIVNSTVARSIELQEAMIAGLTTKRSHRGYGMRIMNIAARRLGYQLNVDISGGIATVVIRGEISR